MVFSEKLRTKLRCNCNEDVLFELIDEIECDWGTHSVIQCPNCQELFSVDKKCPTFQDIFELTKINSELFTEKEKIDYYSNSHPC